MAAIEWKNFGVTPAHDVEMVGNVCLTAWPIDASRFPALDQEQGSRQILGPTATTTKWEISAQPLILSAADMTGLQNGTLVFVVFGKTTYRDAFGRKQWTTYRYFTGGPTGIRGISMSAHDDGNDTS